jgi:hypothetical protein
MVDEIFPNFLKQKNANIFSSIEARDMKILPFDASHHGESNKPCFVPLRSLDAKIIWFKQFKINKIEKRYCISAIIIIL